MNIEMYYKVLQKGWWINLLAILTAINITLIIDYFAPPAYESKTRMLVVPNPDSFTRRDFIACLVARLPGLILNLFSKIPSAASGSLDL